MAARGEEETNSIICHRMRASRGRRGLGEEQSDLSQEEGEGEKDSMFCHTRRANGGRRGQGEEQHHLSRKEGQQREEGTGRRAV